MYRALWTRQRRRVWERDGGICQRCRQAVPLGSAHIDHILPVSKGGTNHQRNLRTLCIICHSLRADPSHDKLWEKAVRKNLINKRAPRWEHLPGEEPWELLALLGKPKKGR